MANNYDNFTLKLNLSKYHLHVDISMKKKLSTVQSFHKILNYTEIKCLLSSDLFSFSLQVQKLKKNILKFAELNIHSLLFC